MIPKRTKASLLAIGLSAASTLWMPALAEASDLDSLSCGLRAVLPSGWEFTECCSLDITFQRSDNPGVKGTLEDFHEEDRAVGSAWQEAQERLADWEEAIPGSQLSGLTATRLGGLDAAMFTRTTSDREEVVVTAVQGNRVIDLIITTPPGGINGYWNDIDTIMRNVRYN